MTLEQIKEIKAFLRSKGLDDDAIDGAMKSITFHEDTAQLRDSDDVKRWRDIMKFKPNPGKATLTQVGETKTYLRGDNRGLPIYQEDVDMIKKALPLAKRLIELQKTKQDGDTGNTADTFEKWASKKALPLAKRLIELQKTKQDGDTGNTADTFEKWAMAEKKEEQTLKTLRDTIDEVYDVNPEELNMGPDTTENINEISEEDRMKLPDRVKESLLRSRGIKKNEGEETPDIMWYFNPESQRLAIDHETTGLQCNKNVSKEKMKESFEKTQEANICMGIHEDRKDPGDYYKYSNILKRMDDTHTRKNNDYGDAAYQGYKKFGPAYFLVQLHNKLSRLESLTINNKTQMVKDESIDDTLLDMANYAIMFLESRHRDD